MSTSTPAQVSPYTSRWRWGVCLLLMMATVINYMDRIALNQTALRIKGSLGLTNEDYGLLESGFSFAFAFGAICTGFIVDRVNVRWVYPVMVLGWSIAGVLTGFATSFLMLLTFRLMLGLFESGNWPCGIRTTRAVLLPEERSFGNSLFQSGTALGAVLTPLVVLYLLHWADPGESQRKAVMAVTGGTYEAVSGAPDNTWQFPFRVIGSLGLVWIVLWFVLLPRRMFVNATGATAASQSDTGAARLRDVFRDIRFWVLFVMVVTINVTWHGYRVWLPLYLQVQRGFTEVEMSKFTTLYYLIADCGSWSAGLATLLLCRRGIGVHAGRTIAFAACCGFAVCTLLIPFVSDATQLQVVLLAVAFGSLGMFPTYFAFTQELSARHQGKVTGILGACAHFSVAAIYPIEGMIFDATHSYESVLAVIGAAPLLALVFLLWKWPARRVPAPGVPDP
jgi:ACS family hexuronate transporter-like MFS transporter